MDSVAPSPTPSLPEASHALIASHVVLIGLTPFVPIPFVDDYIKDRVQRRLVQELARAHGVTLAPADVPILADDPRRWGRSAVRFALRPMKKLFKKTFFVLGFKGSIDVASLAWHRAFLLDHALASGWCAREGGPGAAEVRSAIDAVCLEIPVKPIEPALEAALKGTRVAFQRAGVTFDRLFRGGAVEVANKDEPSGVVSIEDREVAGLAARIREQISAVPEAHFERLREALARRLATPSAGERPLK